MLLLMSDVDDTHELMLFVYALRPHDGVVIVKRLGHAVKVRPGSEQDEHVEDLVRAAPDVEGAWRAALRPADLRRLDCIHKWHYLPDLLHRVPRQRCTWRRGR